MLVIDLEHENSSACGLLACLLLIILEPRALFKGVCLSVSVSLLPAGFLAGSGAQRQQQPVRATSRRQLTASVSSARVSLSLAVSLSLSLSLSLSVSLFLAFLCKSLHQAKHRSNARPSTGEAHSLRCFPWRGSCWLSCCLARWLVRVCVSVCCKWLCCKWAAGEQRRLWHGTIRSEYRALA